MSKYKISLSLCILFFALLGKMTSAQPYDSYSGYIQEVERYYYNGLLTYDKDYPSTGSDNFAYCGKSATSTETKNTFRLIYIWFLNIPVNAIIDGATLYLTGTVTSNAPQFDPAYVEYQIKTFPNDKFESLGGEQWTAITNATLLETEQAPRSPNSFQDYSISLNQTALTYIKNSLSSGRLHLSFRATEEETFGTNRNIHLVDFKLNPNKSVSNSVRLVINWHLPGSISITADNNFTAPNGTHGVIQISGYGNQTAPFTFSKTEGESVSLTAISPQNDNQSHQVLWHTGSIRKSEWWRNGVPTGNDQTKTFTVTADDNGKTYQVQFTKNYAISRNDKTEFNGTIGAGVVTYIVEGNTDTVPAPGTKTVGSNVYTFAGFEDSDGNLCPNR